MAKSIEKLEYEKNATARTHTIFNQTIIIIKLNIQSKILFYITECSSQNDSDNGNGNSNQFESIDTIFRWFIVVDRDK